MLVHDFNLMSVCAFPDKTLPLVVNADAVLTFSLPQFQDGWKMERKSLCFPRETSNFLTLWIVAEVLKLAVGFLGL